MKLVCLSLCVVVCLCGCKKKAAPPAAASDTAAADTAKPNAAAPAPASAPGAVASAPDNPGLKAPPPGPPVKVNGVTINVQEAEKALATASWDANVAMGNLRYALRYEDFRAALGHLQKAAADPSVNSGQKAVLEKVMAEVSQAAATAPR